MPLSKSRRVALVATLLVPLGLLHAFVLAEICIGITDILFLAEMSRTGNLSWAKQPWFIIAISWWGWTLICSLPLPSIGLHGFNFAISTIQALVIFRLIIFVVALQSWVLTTERSRYTLWLLIAISALWISLESWQQFFTGHNIFGNPRYVGDPHFDDGSLTGPFWKPRAGDLYGHILLVGLLPPWVAFFARPGNVWRVAGYILAIIGVATSIFIGQRMGTLFTFFGLMIAALFMPQLRRSALIVTATAAILIMLTPFISPLTYKKLVGETSRQVSHYSLSPYGEIETRAYTMGMASPITGWGYNGYREYCPQDRFAAGIPALGVAPTTLQLAACNLHPHNFYLQAFSDAGFPGLGLFILMNLLWLLRMFRGIWKDKNPIQVGLFIGALTFIWPIASTDEFPTLYLPGWMFLILGLGFAYTHIKTPAVTEVTNV